MDSNMSIMDSIRFLMDSVWTIMDSISVVMDSKSLICKFSLLENEKSAVRRVKSYLKSRISPEFVLRKPRLPQPATIFTKKQTKSPLKPHPTSTSLGKTTPN